MFTIGAFANLTGVSAKRLRHYDTRGLFRPVWVDPSTHYRYYTATQIPELRRIASLIDLGVPLRRIAGVREGGATLVEELKRRRSELEAERSTLERRLTDLEIRLEHSGDVDVVVRRRPPGRWASLRCEVPSGADLAPLFVEIESHVLSHDARASLPPVCVLHGDNHESRMLELLIPIDRKVPQTERITVAATPGTLVASTLVVGGYRSMPEATAGLTAWAKRAGRRVIGPTWYVYLQFGAEEELRLPAEFLTTESSKLVTEVDLEIE